MRKTCLLLIPRYEFFTGRRDGGVELLNTSLETRSQPPEITQGSDLSCQPTSRQYRRYQHGTRSVSVYIKFKTTPRNLVSSRVNSLRSWRYCVGARLKFWQRSCVPKKGSRDEVVEIPSRLRRRDCSAVKSHSTTTQYRQLRRLSSKITYLHPFTNCNIEVFENFA